MKSYFYIGSVHLREKLTLLKITLSYLSTPYILGYGLTTYLRLKMVSNKMGDSMKNSGSVGCSTSE